MALSLDERKKIRDFLPHGAQAHIARVLKLSRVAVCSYFAGTSNSLRIEREAVKLYAEYKQELKDMQKIIND